MCYARGITPVRRGLDIEPTGVMGESDREVDGMRDFCERPVESSQPRMVAILKDLACGSEPLTRYHTMRAEEIAGCLFMG